MTDVAMSDLWERGWWGKVLVILFIAVSVPLLWIASLTARLQCRMFGHDIHTFPAPPTPDFCGVYCTRCNTVWNVDDDGKLVPL